MLVHLFRWTPLFLNCKVGPATRVSVAGVQRDVEMVIWEIPGSSRRPRFRRNRAPDPGSQNWHHSSIQTKLLRTQQAPIVPLSNLGDQGYRLGGKDTGDKDTHDENQTNCRDWHHDGRWDVAKAMVREAAANGATLAKFQTYIVGQFGKDHRWYDEFRGVVLTKCTRPNAVIVTIARMIFLGFCL